MADDLTDLITGKPLEPWAQQMMERAKPSELPTRAMIAAGERALVGMSDEQWGRAEKVWNAMSTAALAAPPTPRGEEYQIPDDFEERLRSAGWSEKSDRPFDGPPVLRAEIGDDARAREQGAPNPLGWGTELLSGKPDTISTTSDAGAFIAKARSLLRKHPLITASWIIDLLEEDLSAATPDAASVTPDAGVQWSDDLSTAPFDKMVLIADTRFDVVAEAIQYRSTGWHTFGANGPFAAKPRAWAPKPPMPPLTSASHAENEK
jgi:hypothetical protein